jgi:glycosyltransferase involved in cell wall biosynthesis
MNIKYITDVRIPTSRAAGYAVMKMCEGFSAAGVNVELIIPNKKDSDFLGDPFEYYKINKKFKINRMYSTDLLSSSWLFGKIFYLIDLITFLLAVKFLSRISKRDLIYTRDYFIPLIFSKKRLVFLELHDIPKSTILFKFAVKNATKVFVLTRYIKEALVSLGVEGSNIYIVPSGVDIKNFDISIDKETARKKLDLPKNDKIIIYTGHLYKWKGVHTLANTAKILKDYLFIFVGGVKPEITEFRKRYEKLTNVLVIPYQDRSVVSLYLKSADVLVIPNSANEKISTSYTSPLKLFEYMASSRPIVASDLPSLREVLNEKNCVFAGADNVDSFANAIKSILEDESLNRAIVSEARSNVERYDWNARAKEILNIIKK